MQQVYVCFISNSISTLSVCFDIQFWPLLTFDLIYFENYLYGFSSNIIFLILLFKLNKMICDKAMFGPQTTKLLHWPWSDHCYPIKVTGAVTIRSGEASSNDFSILMTYTSLLAKFHNLFTFWTIEAHWPWHINST